MTLLHATAVAIQGRGVLLTGPSGAGKSDLALRLIDRGAVLVGDDAVDVVAEAGALVVRGRASVRGLIEARGVGVFRVASVDDALLALVVDLAAAPERLPEATSTLIEGIALPRIALAAFEASAPLKVEHALRRLVLPDARDHA